MFWKKKKKTEIPKQALMLQTYLLGCPVFMDGRPIGPIAKTGIQVFILGMVDKLRQVENLSWEQFLAIYSSLLSQHDIHPPQPVAEFVDLIGKRASRDNIITEAMSMGAQSITMYVSRRDAEAPIDLLSMLTFAENHKESFAQIEG